MPTGGHEQCYSAVFHDQLASSPYQYSILWYGRVDVVSDVYQRLTQRSFPPRLPHSLLPLRQRPALCPVCVGYRSSGHIFAAQRRDWHTAVRRYSSETKSGTSMSRALRGTLTASNIVNTLTSHNARLAHSLSRSPVNEAAPRETCFLEGFSRLRLSPVINPTCYIVSCRVLSCIICQDRRNAVADYHAVQTSQKTLCVVLTGLQNSSCCLMHAHSG